MEEPPAEAGMVDQMEEIQTKEVLSPGPAAVQLAVHHHANQVEEAEVVHQKVYQDLQGHLHVVQTEEVTMTEEKVLHQ